MEATQRISNETDRVHTNVKYIADKVGTNKALAEWRLQSLIWKQSRFKKDSINEIQLLFEEGFYGGGNYAKQQLAIAKRLAGPHGIHIGSIVFV